ncbi:MAG: hypothetical protein GXP45_07500 [bacterium]|nr:hypothetical protein [bacterium]
MGEDIPEKTFADLHQRFQKVLPHFPKDFEFQVTYEQCLLTTENLSKNYSYARLSAFQEKCYQPFSSIVKSVNSKYTVVASAKVNPGSGPAPLTVTFDARASVDPSNETIPRDNFFRYYRDIDGNDKTIGIGPVVTHTFEHAGNYIVHLTVRSSNKTSK